MSKGSTPACIRLRGVRQNNLRGFDLDLPLGRLVVITGLSGSGKSSLAFETLFAEGQRRYIETFSPYARQFFDRMDKPQVDSIEGIPPAIAIEQKNSVKSTRSTVGTMTELCDYLKLLWPHLSQLHCRNCAQPVRKEPPQLIWETLRRDVPDGAEVLLTFTLPLSEKLSLADSFELLSRQGYQRVWLAGEVVRLEEALPRLQAAPPASVVVAQDRVRVGEAVRARFVEACEQAYHFGKGRLAIHVLASGDAATGDGKDERVLQFSAGFHCATCDLDYREPTPALFSFNHPVGACPACRGFGRTVSIDYDLAVPDRSKTIAEGVVRPWQSGTGAESQVDLLKFCKTRKVPIHVPFHDLPRPLQDWVISGDPDYGKDAAHEWPRAWYGVKGYFRWLESKSYKMHVRVLLSRYRAYTNCPACSGRRFQAESLLHTVRIASAELAGAAAELPGEVPKESPSESPKKLTLADFYALPIETALACVNALSARIIAATNASNAVVASDGAAARGKRSELEVILGEVRSRLGYLVEVGLGYLTLDRPTRSLSGGETERVNLTTCLGTRLVNTLFVLDEPSVGLHPRDTGRLVDILQKLRDAGNSVVVVEHEASVMRAADQIVDLGPGHGESGGRIVFQGTYAGILDCARSLTGQYLSGAKTIPAPTRRAVSVADADSAMLRIVNAHRHNLRGLNVAIPLGRFVCLTGVSGSGKTTLAREILLPALQARLKPAPAAARPAGEGEAGADENAGGDEEAESTTAQSATLTGHESLGAVVLVDQSPLGKTPRSNPAVYIGAFEDIRELFAQSETARQRGLGASAFSFNSAQGQCDRCRGAGFEKIEMQFLSDIFIRCPECNGRRYRGHILEVRLDRPVSAASNQNNPREPERRPPARRVAAVGLEPSRAGDRRSARVAGSEIQSVNFISENSLLVQGRSGKKRTLAASSTSEPRFAAAGELPADYSASAEPLDSLSIADLLEATVDDAIRFLAAFADSKPAARAVRKLQLLQEVGLGYLRLGQPINTLSGGESQRLKLVSHLAESAATAAGDPSKGAKEPIKTGTEGVRPTLFVFDEPTTGLHFDDVRVLLAVFQRLVEAGHSVLVIEHNLDVIRCADWVLDLGPEAGERGGKLVVAGTPETVAACVASHTGAALRGLDALAAARPKGDVTRVKTALSAIES